MMNSRIANHAGVASAVAEPSHYLSTREMFYEWVPYVFIFIQVLSSHSERWLI